MMDNDDPKKGLQTVKAGTWLTESSKKPSAAKMQEVKALVKSILIRWPDYGKAAIEYKLALVEYFAGLSDVEQTYLADPQFGLSAKSEFLPTQALCEKLLEERRNRWGTPRDYSGYKRDENGRLVDDPGGYKPQIVPYISNREHRNPLFYEASKIDEEASKAGMLRAARMVAYVKTLGAGNAEKGWLIAIERGIEEPPADFQVDTLVSK
jgi:hypothetical protein